MINQKRLTRIETSLTPKQAVLLWLRQEHQGRTSIEYLRYMIQRPPSARPRARVETQVIDAIRAALNGRDRRSNSSSCPTRPDVRRLPDLAGEPNEQCNSG